jgi:creatinine amidohydrolase
MPKDANATPTPGAPTTAPPKGISLEDLTWVEAERALTPDAIVVVPIGAAAKEHGPHLKLKNDWLLAEYFKRRLMEREKVVVAPVLAYHFYPAFVDYPGSTHLRLETARDLTVDVVRSLARHGPRRFYALNTGVSTLRALRPAAEELAKEGILLRFTNLLEAMGPTEKRIAQQEGGTHADEIETSMMLYIAPGTVDMRKAVKEYHGAFGGALSRTPQEGRTYSPSGIFGDATLATVEKGRIMSEALVDALVSDVAELRAAPLPGKE